MQVVRHSADGERLHSVIPGNASQILAQEAMFAFRYERPPIFCAENYVDVDANIRMGHGACRPSGAHAILDSPYPGLTAWAITFRPFRAYHSSLGSGEPVLSCGQIARLERRVAPTCNSPDRKVWVAGNKKSREPRRGRH